MQVQAVWVLQQLPNSNDGVPCGFLIPNSRARPADTGSATTSRKLIALWLRFGVSLEKTGSPLPDRSTYCGMELHCPALSLCR